MYRLALLRHGESLWNRENRFTGWTDVGLSTKGEQEALQAAETFLKEGYSFDLAFTSLLKRAIKTLWIVLERMDLMWIGVDRSYKLNERHYGALQGLNKEETARRHGEEQVKKWRRSYSDPPPFLSADDEQYPGRDPRYSDLSPAELPLGESLRDTVARVVPHYEEKIAPALAQGRHILIAAHGNSLRALVKHLEQIADEEIVSLNIPTGIPLIYEMDSNLRPQKRFYLGDPQLVAKASAAVAAQGKAKP